MLISFNTKTIKNTKALSYCMKKALVFLILIFFLANVCALERCTYVSWNVVEPESLAEVTAGVPFKMKLMLSGYYDDGIGGPCGETSNPCENCETDLTFEYINYSLSLPSYQRIPDLTFDPPSGVPGVYPIESKTGYPSPEKDNETYCDCIATGTCVADFTGIYEIWVVCNDPITTSHDYDYGFRAKSTDAPSSGINPSIGEFINCVPATGPVNTPPIGSFVSPEGDSAVYGTNYTVEWEAFDAENNPLTYTLYWENESLSDVGSVDTGLDKSYTMTGLVIGEDYTFSVEVDDGVNESVEFFSDVLSVMAPLDYLSISALTVTPEVINGNEKIEVYLEVRNESDRSVDINVWFFNENFDDGPLADEHFRREINVPANSKQSFSMEEDFVDLAVPLTAGEYSIEVVVQGFFSGTRERTNSKDISAFAYFTVLVEQKSLSLPETGIIAVLLILIAVALILRKKKK